MRFGAVFRHAASIARSSVPRSTFPSRTYVHPSSPQVPWHGSKAAGCVEEAAVAPPETLDSGDWTLFLEITDLGGGKLGGSAAASLADGTTCDYALSGKYDSKSDVASLKFSPTNAVCDKTKISLKDVRVGATLEAQMKYKLFGQAGDTPVESVDQ